MSSVLEEREEVPEEAPILEIEGLTKYFQSESGILSGLFGSEDVEAVDDVTFDLKKGETLALVGESGCGKSTLARTILKLTEPTAGTVRFKGIDLTETSARELRPLRRDMPMVFQDPQSSLNPRMKVGPIIEEPMKAHGIGTKAERRERAKELLDRVELDRSYYNRYPHEFSGGQRQRINLARAMSTDPDLIIADEPVSALDVSVQAQVLNTMRDLQREFGLTYLIITHDLSVVRYIADRVAVMYLGHLVELAGKEELFENPQHPYTEALLSAIPVPDPRVETDRGALEGDVPSPIDPPSGCRFRTRCPKLIQPGTFDLDPADLDEEIQEGACSSYGMPETVWSDTLRFTRAVRRRSFTVVEGGMDEDESVPVEDVERIVDREFFAGGRPDGEPGDVVDRSISLIADNEWEEAAETLSMAFEEASICARERPAYTVPTEYGTEEHFAACHLHRGQ
ncbi:MAG: ABC transporter ATP-binding protein [Halalkalicoccus sp.]